jgi:hypothetical protein
MRGASLLKPASRRKEHEALGGAGIDRTSKAVAYVVCICNQQQKKDKQPAAKLEIEGIQG